MSNQQGNITLTCINNGPKNGTHYTRILRLQPIQHIHIHLQESLLLIRSYKVCPPNTTYYFRAFATNTKGTTYGDTLSFKTAGITALTISGKARDTICAGASTTITYTATPDPSGTYTYAWSTSGGSATASTTNTYAVTYTAAGPYTITCTAGGRTNTITTTIVVNNSPTVHISDTAGGTAAATATICTGNNITLYAVASGTPSYQWYKGGSVISGATNANYTIAEDADSYTVKVTDGNGCEKTSAACRVKIGLTPSFTTCEDCEVGTSYIKSKTNVVSMSWKNASDSVVSNSQDFYSGVPGIYTITATSSDGCTVTDTISLSKVYTTCTVAALNSDTTVEKGSGPRLDSVADHQHNLYEVVQIGNQCWLRENMRCTTSPRQGTINLTQGIGSSNKTPYYYTNKGGYHPDTTVNIAKWGRLYNWCAAMDTSVTTTYPDMTFTGHRRGICPSGWHLPTDAEWTQLEAFVSGVESATIADSSGYRADTTDIASALSGGCDWSSSIFIRYTPGNYASSTRNRTLFSAQPGGCYICPSGDAGTYAYFWTSSQSIGGYAGCRRLHYFFCGVSSSINAMKDGLSVRCVRD